ncbi:MAG TPA: alpha/beta hydrolase [Dehalococcoidia bacterium]|nr:alpha/beta hydrolase [Dehalococcoidia bacterium]
MAETAPARRIAVTAPDGIEIVGSGRGAGRGLALVYGAMMEQVGWDRLVPYLQPGRAIYTYDRRGRGESTDAPVYAVDREVDDLIAFVEALPQTPDLFAHSSGALLALLAVERGLAVRRLVLYEPPMAALRLPALSLDLPDRIDALVAQGDRDAALDLFFREGMEQLAMDIQRLRDGPRWQDQMRYVQTGAYDVRITRTYEVRPERLAQINVPTLFLLGTDSPEWMQEGVRKFASLVPGSRLEMLEGQGHNAQFQAPDVLARAINAFLG